jgi:hypothetical protein
MPTPTLEERVAAVENELTLLRRQLEGEPVQVGDAWWTKIIGVYRDSADFEEAVRLGREYRRSLAPIDEDPS